ncbi:putative ferrooxidoreductase [Diplodia seriata]|uniref:Putative ferrooxidoreductase n=1 Tax=Diplodia seriata TaxID=420778 RepID=A0A0G2HFA6_9PEZI|nr:putative ferrooxidoreductase [Diplodia seriata]
MAPFPSLLALLASSLASAATVNLDWNVTWTTANPDGMMERPVIGINGNTPQLTVLNITKGDRVITKLTNGLGNETTSLHFHGFYQNGTNSMDGPPGADQVGTYWYHSHTKGQYPDGFRQALIIQDPDSPYAGQYDDEFVISLSDWYHDQMPGLLKQFISVSNPTGAEPVPKAALINDTSDFTLAVEPGKTYLVHLANVGAFAGQYFWVEGHTMKIVEVDGIWTEAAQADMIYIASAQRYAVLLTTKNDTSANFPIVASMDTTLFDTLPDDLNWNATGWLVYDESKHRPSPAILDELDPYDDFNLTPTDGLELYDEADYTITLDLTMDNLGDGANYAFFNDITYTRPKVPTLYSVLTTGAAASNATIYGHDTNPFVLPHNAIIDIVLNNDDTGRHPFHLHGHAFQIITRSPENAGHYAPNTTTTASFPRTPARRDTVLVYPSSNFVLRFRADNPGVWLFHCHIEWHMASGLAATLVEAPMALQRALVVPDNHLESMKPGLL